MTVSNETNRTSAVGSGSTGQEIPFNFPADNIIAYKLVTATGVQTTLTETTNYTVVFTGDVGGTVTTVTAIETTEEIHILGADPYTQQLDLEQGGSYNAENIEDALDKNTRLSTQNKDLLSNKAILFPITDASGLTTVLPSSVDRKSKNITCDSEGNIAASVVVEEGEVNFTTFGTNMAEAANAPAGKVVLNIDHVIDVTDSTYGALGDGSTDDATAIQAAFDALSDGDTILFPNTGSDYIVKTGLTCSADNIRIIGPCKESGSRLDFQSMAGADGLTLSGFGYYIENLHIVSTDNSTDDGLLMDRGGTTATNDNTLVHCQFTGHGGNGIEIVRPVTTVLFGCKAASNVEDGFSLNLAGTSTSLINCWAFSNTLFGCHATSVTGFSWIGGANTGNGDYAFRFATSTGAIVSGVDGESATNGFARIGSDCNGVKISDCYVADSDTIAFHLGGSNQTVIDNIIFESISGDHFRLDGVLNCHIGVMHDLDSDNGTMSFDKRTGSCTSINAQIISVTDGSATPDATAANTLKTTNTSTTVITNFGNGMIGQTIKLIINDAFTQVDFGGTLKGNGGLRWFPSAGDFLTATYDGTNWYCVVSSLSKHNIVCNENQVVCNENQVVTN